MSNPNIAFIGGGNMAKSIIGGLLKNGHPPECITVSDPNQTQLQALEDEYGIHICQDNAQACQDADAILLAVKPQIMQVVLEPLANLPNLSDKLFISIAAGLRIDAMSAWLGCAVPFIRCMPNTPALVQCGASALFANSQSNEQHKALAHNLLSSVGIVEWVGSEADLDAITALSGSGPAYFFLLIEALEKAAQDLGLPASVCHAMATQTALGAATMAVQSEQTPAQLREAVTSKGGTTAAALDAFYQGNFSQLVSDAVNAAHRRSQTLSEELEG